MSCSWGVCRSLGLLAAGTIFTAGGAASAQAPLAAAAVQALPAPGEGAELRRHLTDLAANPRSLQSLIGAGRAAVGVGDGHAALGFFARAEEIAPQDARVKAGMASAFVLLEQPQAAIRFFAEAVRLGAPEGEVARDRGLAYDMLGDPNRAQQDYGLALQHREDAEARRRLALSLAISGNRQAALSALDPLLRSQDRAAYRTRAFVLALTGDANGAAQAVESSMPGQSSAMAPFLSRLAGLSPAQKAMAVHFGQFPADGRAVRMAEWGGSGQPQAQQPARPTPSAARPTASAARPTPSATRPTQVTSRQPEPARPSTIAPLIRRPVQVARAELPIAQPRQSPPQAQQQPAAAAAAATPAPETAPVRIAVAETQPPPDPVLTETAATTPAPERSVPAFEDIAALVRSLPVERDEDRPAAAPAVVRPQPTRPVSTAATGRPAATRTAAATTPPRTTRPAVPAHPSRHWVQVAGGSRAAFNFQIGRIRQSASALMQGRQAYFAANGNSSRLLVGPFPTSRAAQDFVNQLARQDVPAFAWTSRAGEEVARLPAR